MHRKFARYCHLFNVNQSILKTATYILYISNNWFDLFNILSNNYLSVNLFINLFIYCFNRYIFLKYRFALLIFIHITSLLFVTPTSNRQFFISSYFIFLLHLWECVALPLRIKSALSTYLSLGERISSLLLYLINGYTYHIGQLRSAGYGQRKF